MGREEPLPGGRPRAEVVKSCPASPPNLGHGVIRSRHAHECPAARGPRRTPPMHHEPRATGGGRPGPCTRVPHAARPAHPPPNTRYTVAFRGSAEQTWSEPCGPLPAQVRVRPPRQRLGGALDVEPAGPGVPPVVVPEQSLQLDDLLVPDVVPDLEHRSVGPAVPLIDPVLPRRLWIPRRRPLRGHTVRMRQAPDRSPGSGESHPRPGTPREAQGAGRLNSLSRRMDTRPTMAPRRGAHYYRVWG